MGVCWGCVWGVFGVCQSAYQLYWRCEFMFTSILQKEKAAGLLLVTLLVDYVSYRNAGFLPGIFSRGKSIVMQISFVMLIFLLFWDQISGEKVSEGGQSASGAPCPPPLWKKARMGRFLQRSLALSGSRIN